MKCPSFALKALVLFLFLAILSAIYFLVMAISVNVLDGLVAMKYQHFSRTMVATTVPNNSKGSGITAISGMLRMNGVIVAQLCTIVAYTAAYTWGIILAAQKIIQTSSEINIVWLGGLPFLVVIQLASSLAAAFYVDELLQVAKLTTGINYDVPLITSKLCYSVFSFMGISTGLENIPCILSGYGLQLLLHLAIIFGEVIIWIFLMFEASRIGKKEGNKDIEEATNTAITDGSVQIETVGAARGTENYQSATQADQLAHNQVGDASNAYRNDGRYRDSELIMQMMDLRSYRRYFDQQMTPRRQEGRHLPPAGGHDPRPLINPYFVSEIFHISDRTLDTLV